MRQAILVCVTSGEEGTQKKLREKDSALRLVYVGAFGGGGGCQREGRCYNGQRGETSPEARANPLNYNTRRGTGCGVFPSLRALDVRQEMMNPRWRPSTVPWRRRPLRLAARVDEERVASETTRGPSWECRDRV